ncbi:Transposable element Tc3 transposase, partial [Araneus ventricosus]
MPRGISLTEFQKGQAIACRNDGKTIREIAGILKIGKSAISEFLKNPGVHGKREKTGRPRKLTPKEQRNLLRQLKKRGASIPTAKRESGLTHITRQTAFNYVQRSKQFRFKKRNHHPKWTKKHIADRLAWGKKYMSWTTEWTSIIFSDEKRFNLDGPDGFQYYWHCLKQKRTILLYSPTRKRKFDDWGGENWIYQQDGASIHTAQGVKKWFDDNNVQVFPWPAKSPDLNIVENVWAMLVERVYGQGRQYENVKELHESLDSVWNTFCQKDIQNLYDSMPNRVFGINTGR